MTDWEETLNAVIAGVGRKSVASAGTPVALGASQQIAYAVLTAGASNAGVIVAGNASVIGAYASRAGTPLAANDDAQIPAQNLADIYIDSTVAADCVSFTFYR